MPQRRRVQEHRGRIRPEPLPCRYAIHLQLSSSRSLFSLHLARTLCDLIRFHPVVCSYARAEPDIMGSRAAGAVVGPEQPLRSRRAMKISEGADNGWMLAKLLIIFRCFCAALISRGFASTFDILYE